MKGKPVLVWSFLAFLMVVFSSVFLATASDKPKSDDLVSKSLASISAPEARAGLRSLSVTGNASAKFLVGGSGTAAGPFTLDSSGHKLILDAPFNLPQYAGEAFAFDGAKKSIGVAYPGQRSQLEDFINNNGEILTEGLLGGTLSTAWSLYDWQDRKAKLDSDGLKKVDGKELLRLTYHPRHGGSSLKIYLFFDPQDFRHVKTIYTQESQAQMGTSPGMSSVGGGASLTLEENFGGFTKVNDLMLPSQWMLKYTQSGIGNGASIIEYDFAVTRIQPNADLSAKAFSVK